MGGIKTRYWAFTWITNIRQHKLPSEFKLARVLNQEFAHAVFKLEIGTKSEKKHWQGYIELNTPRTSKKNVLAIFESRFKNIAGLTISPVANREAIHNYVIKEETQAGKINYCGVKEVYDQEFANTSLREWQQSIFDYLLIRNKDKDYRSRKILYIEDQKGNSGKSHFTKYMRIGQKKLKAFKLPVNSVDRLLSATNLLIKQENKIDVLIIDIPRTMGADQHLEDLWSAIEDIKNGHILDVMFGKFNECLFKPPIVLVFTNIPMSQVRERLSEDRWEHLFLNGNNPRELEMWTRVLDDCGNSFIRTTKLKDKIIELQPENHSSVKTSESTPEI